VTFLLRALNSVAGPWIIGGVAAVFLVTVAGFSARLWLVQRDLDRVTGERDNALTELGACQQNRAALEAGIAAQNAAVAALGAESSRRLEASRRALEASRRGIADMERRVAILSREPAGRDECERVRSARTQVLESLR